MALSSHFVLQRGHAIGFPSCLLCLKQRMRHSVCVRRPHPYLQFIKSSVCLSVSQQTQQVSSSERGLGATSFRPPILFYFACWAQLVGLLFGLLVPIGTPLSI